MGILYKGLRFDLSALFMCESLFVVVNLFPFPFREHTAYRIFRMIVYLAPIIAAISANLVDAIYFRFTLKRMTGDIINYLKAGGSDALRLLPQFIVDFWPIVLIMVSILIVLSWAAYRLFRKISGRVTLASFLIQLIIFLLVVPVSVLGIRGGFQLKPINIINAGTTTKQAHVPLVLNSAFTLIKTWRNRELEEVRYFNDQASLEKVFNPVHHLKSHLSPADSQNLRNNVVIIILESLSSEHVGALNPGSVYPGGSYTPFLDSLIGESLAFNGYANGKRSIEAVPAILSSLPSLMNNDFITSSYAGAQINSLASILKEEGYATAFYHGGNNGTMNFDAYAKKAGFDSYYGRNEYGNDRDFDGKWGIFDEPFLQYVVKSMGMTRQPFLTTVFTLSSHHPYTIPEKHKGKFCKGKLPIQESIAYTDYALGVFFHAASQQAWFKNTLFVITADHSSEAERPYYKSPTGVYRVPVIFYKSGYESKKIKGGVVQHLDIMPSVLDFLGKRTSFVAFGNSVFDTLAPKFAISYLNGYYLLIKDHHAIYFTAGKAVSYFDLKNDSLSKRNIIDSKPVDMPASVVFLEAIIQQYNHRVISNRLYLGKDEKATKLK